MKFFGTFQCVTQTLLQFTGKRLCVSSDGVHIPRVCVCVCLYVSDLHFSMRTSQQLSVSHKGYLTFWKLMEMSSHNARHSEQKKIRGEKKIMEIDGSVFGKCGSSAG